MKLFLNTISLILIVINFTGCLSYSYNYKLPEVKKRIETGKNLTLQEYHSKNYVNATHIVIAQNEYETLFEVRSDMEFKDKLYYEAKYITTKELMEYCNNYKKGTFTNNNECIGTNDDFRIESIVEQIETGKPKTFRFPYYSASFFVLVKHDKKQRLNQRTNDFENWGDMYHYPFDKWEEIRHRNIYYVALRAKYLECLSKSQGELWINNKITNNKYVKFNDFLIERIKYNANVERVGIIRTDYETNIICSKEKPLDIAQGLVFPGNDKTTKIISNNNQVEDEIKELALQAYNTKSDFTKIKGTVEFDVNYNGKLGFSMDPHLSVIKTNGNRKDIYNYEWNRSNNKLISLGKTGVQNLTREAAEQFKNKLTTFKLNCRANGNSLLYINEFTATCKRNYDNELVIKVFKQNQYMLFKNIEN